MRTHASATYFHPIWRHRSLPIRPVALGDQVSQFLVARRSRNARTACTEYHAYPIIARMCMPFPILFQLKGLSMLWHISLCFFFHIAQ